MNSPFLQEEHLIPWSWQDQAACASRDIDPEIFFSPERGRPSNGWGEEAIAICRRCKVRNECLETALLFRENSGIWGGMKPFERRNKARESGERATAD
ncbi:WhiB family transcriptional regulator [Streptomyces sp. NPDC004787]|uniref:WhiB family transcriptional regulator n=1 Tax=Streptomyces sp. NPDC004787 TaxID=3154291 RepID=UPI0033BC46A0